MWNTSGASGWMTLQLFTAPLVIPAMIMGAAAGGVVGRRLKRRSWAVLSAALATDVFASLLLIFFWEKGPRWGEHLWFVVKDAFGDPGYRAQQALHASWGFQEITLLPSLLVAEFVAFVAAFRSKPRASPETRLVRVKRAAGAFLACLLVLPTAAVLVTPLMLVLIYCREKRELFAWSDAKEVFYAVMLLQLFTLLLSLIVAGLVGLAAALRRRLRGPAVALLEKARHAVGRLVPGGRE
jgi:hypothetical protein